MVNTLYSALGREGIPTEQNPRKPFRGHWAAGAYPTYRWSKVTQHV